MYRSSNGRMQSSKLCHEGSTPSRCAIGLSFSGPGRRVVSAEIGGSNPLNPVFLLCQCSYDIKDIRGIEAAAVY